MIFIIFYLNGATVNKESGLPRMFDTYDEASMFREDHLTGKDCIIVEMRPAKKAN